MDDGTVGHARREARAAGAAGDDRAASRWALEAHRRERQDAATGLPTYSAALRRVGLMQHGAPPVPRGARLPGRTGEGHGRHGAADGRVAVDVRCEGGHEGPIEWSSEVGEFCATCMLPVDEDDPDGPPEWTIVELQVREPPVPSGGWQARHGARGRGGMVSLGGGFPRPMPYGAGG